LFGFWEGELVLQCIVHKGCKGLTANPDGETHGVIIPVPVNMIGKGGIYRFVLHFYDDYADSYKNHQIKVALEVNAIERWYPITYHSGKYKDSVWYVAWCRAPQMVSKKTFFKESGTNVIDEVKGETPKGSGKVAAGVNGGFFYSGHLIGEVGTDSGWKGNPMDFCRWAFGMNEKGWGHNVVRMVSSSDGKYVAPKELKEKYIYGLSGIGALIHEGKALFVDKNNDGKVDDDAYFMDDDLDGKVDEDPKNDKDDDGDGKKDEDPQWPDVLAKRQRTALAWGSKYFFLISAENWTWDETVTFCQDELPKLVKELYPKIDIKIINAVMLDGGDSVKFLWRYASKKGEEENQPGENGYQANSDRLVLTYILAWANCD